MPTEERLQSFVDDGSAWLDAVWPEWFEEDHVDPDRLDMSNPCSCLFGQALAHKVPEPYPQMRVRTDTPIESGYWYFKELLRSWWDLAFGDVIGTPTWLVHHGFEAPGNDNPYRYLTEAWVAAIEERRHG